MWNVPDINAINYFSFVDEILTNDDLFATFKENPYYNAIVGMSCEPEAEWFANNLKDNNSINLKIEEFKKNDSIGEPAVFDSKEYGFISPNTLRYLNSLQNIQANSLMAWCLRVCTTYEVKLDEFKSERRYKNLVQARTDFCHAVYKNTDYNYSAIARFMNKDHSSVLHYIKKLKPKYFVE